MKQTTLILVFFLFAILTYGQKIPQEYFSNINIADSLYYAKDYKKSANKFSEAFKSNNWNVLLFDRYKAACSWALAAVPDSAFFQLERVANDPYYTIYEYITTDSNLITLHNDSRWNSIIDRVKKNKDAAEAKINKPLAATLDSVFVEDQKYREQIDIIEKKYGWKSQEMNDLYIKMGINDSINLLKVTYILDKYGWLGSDVIRSKGNAALFLVIQHSDLEIQLKYLPMMREAVKKGTAYGRELALLEDRVAMRQGRKQIYGSQIGRDPETQSYYVSPLEDPDNVDKRRAEVGLGLLSEYVNHWQIKWDIEQYKKDLPKIEEREKNNHN